jgi:hypothetical protein
MLAGVGIGSLPRVNLNCVGRENMINRKENKNRATSSDGSVKVFKCLFFEDVLCSFRKSEKFAILDQCFKCPHYSRFIREMDEEDQRVMDEIDEIRRTGVWK